MSLDQLTMVMERLLDLHKSLLELANKKTVIIERGDMAALNSIVKEEQKLLPTLNKYEQVRQQVVRNFLAPFHVGEELLTISTCLEHTEGDSRATLSQLRDELLNVATNLQKQNELNSQLVKQSLQFVHLSLEMLYPKTPSINYGPPSQVKTAGTNSLFNRKA